MMRERILYAVTAVSLTALILGACGQKSQDSALQPQAETPSAEPGAVNTPEPDAGETPADRSVEPPRPVTPPKAIEPTPAPSTNPAAAFTLPDLDGNEHSLADYAGKVVVLEWMNHDCPFVKKHYTAGNMQALQTKYTSRGVVWLSICSSGPGKQGHFTTAEWKKRQVATYAAPTAVLLDPEGKVGRSYGARTTPHMFVINKEGGIEYAGAIDDRKRARGAAIANSRNYVAEALDSVLAGESPKVTTTEPYG